MGGAETGIGNDKYLNIRRFLKMDKYKKNNVFFNCCLVSYVETSNPGFMDKLSTSDLLSDNLEVLQEERLQGMIPYDNYVRIAHCLS